MNFKVVTIIVIAILLTVSVQGFCQEYVVNSPDEKISLKIAVGEKLVYSVNYLGNNILRDCQVALEVKGSGTWGIKEQVDSADKATINEILTPVVRFKRDKIINSYNGLTLSFRGDHSLAFRVFDDGVAYRWESSKKQNIQVLGETAIFNFVKDSYVFYPSEPDVFTSFQRNYDYLALSSITEKQMSITPVLVDIADGPKVAITEADLEDYPGMFLKGNSDLSLKGYFTKAVTKDYPVSDKIVERADYLAKTSGERTFPWRVLAIAGEDADLIRSHIVYCLAKPLQLKETAWIKPGKVAWDWWNANNIYNVDFRAGINTDTYKYYMDFAAENGLEYVIFDEGWSHTHDIFQLNNDMDMEALTQYAKSKGVGIILWVEWRTFGSQLDEALEQFSKWDIKGIKVDFMRRDDQEMVNYYHKIAKACAEKKLLVNFHGSYKPTGIERAYPNVLTREGVNGLEQGKWSKKANPEYNVTLPFIRMLAGPVDYTPGAMLNAQEKDFAPIWDRPMSLGTRCHQLAMYVVFESPLQMLSDSPTNYMKEKECLEFLKSVPTVWDETVVLKSKVSDYICLARRSGNSWYLGAMTDWSQRDLKLDFSFLPPGEHTIESYRDGINADRCAMDYKKTSGKISANEKLNIHLAPGGGWVGIIKVEK